MTSKSCYNSRCRSNAIVNVCMVPTRKEFRSTAAAGMLPVTSAVASSISYVWTMFLSFSLSAIVMSGKTLAGECNFPKTWRGRWFESASTSVVISANEISNKGNCYDQNRDFFLVENKLEHCHQCLLIVPRHTNVIQYKQSYCIGRQSLQSICAQIRVGSVFITLVREQATPVPCPVVQSYHFVYNNNSQCYCRSPMSYVHQCADDTKLRFQFRQCPHCIHTVDREIEFECLATWMEGPGFYAIGAFIGHDSSPKVSSSSSAAAAASSTVDLAHNNKPERLSYHCFMYHTYSSVMYIVMSSDTVCRGNVRSPREGLLTMELTRDIYGWPDSRCIYPSWLFAKSAWRSMDGSMRYSFGLGGDVMIRQHNVNTSSTKHVTTYKCLHLTEDGDANTSDVNDHVAYATVHVVDGCSSSFRCMKMHRRRQVSLVQLKFGKLLEDGEQICNETAFVGSNHVIVDTQLLINVDLVDGPCPYTGLYTTAVSEDGCRVQLQSGCRHRSRIDNVTLCNPPTVLQPPPPSHHLHHIQQQQQHFQHSTLTDTQRLSCIVWWSTLHKVYMLVRPHDESETHSLPSPVYCYSFWHRDDVLEVTYESQCDFNTSHNYVSKPLVFLPRLEPCSVDDVDDRSRRVNSGGRNTISQRHSNVEHNHDHMIHGDDDDQVVHDDIPFDDHRRYHNADDEIEIDYDDVSSSDTGNKRHLSDIDNRKSSTQSKAIGSKKSVKDHKQLSTRAHLSSGTSNMMMSWTRAKLWPVLVAIASHLFSFAFISFHCVDPLSLTSSREMSSSPLQSRFSYSFLTLRIINLSASQQREPLHSTLTSSDFRSSRWSHALAVTSQDVLR